MLNVAKPIHNMLYLTYVSYNIECSIRLLDTNVVFKNGGYSHMKRLSVRKRSKSFMFLVSISFIILFISSLCVLSFIVFSRWRASINNTITQLEESASKNIVSNIDSLVNTPLYMNEINYNIIKNQILDLQDKDARDRYFVGVIRASSEDIYSFSYGTEDGNYYGVLKTK